MTTCIKANTLTFDCGTGFSRASGVAAHPPAASVESTLAVAIKMLVQLRWQQRR
jgi:hypothetical protein